MPNPFSGAAMAAGYATARPPVHRAILRRALSPGQTFGRSLDVGCGAGVSTKALAGFARLRAGLEPVELMLRHAGSLDPDACFVAGSAEHLPFAAGSIDLIAAAGSLNYVDLPRFFREAARVLAPRGVLLVYDFSTGCAGRNWLDAFVARYPWPVGHAQPLDPQRLGAMNSGFGLVAGQHLEIMIPMTRPDYLRYLMTETNVAEAVRSGTPANEVHRWCDESLASEWRDGVSDISFNAYYARLAMASHTQEELR